MPLTSAFANKVVTVILGMLFGIWMLVEHISPQRLAGAAFAVVGTIIFVFLVER